VELENGRVSPHRNATPPVKAHALLTILETEQVKLAAPADPGAGLRRFLTMPDLALMPEQFRASMEADFLEQ